MISQSSESLTTANIKIQLKEGKGKELNYRGARSTLTAAISAFF